MKTTDIQKFLKKNQKPLLIALGVLVVAVVVWLVVRNAARRKDSENNNPETITGTTITIGIDFRELAERMLHAFIDRFGTDEDAVYAVLDQLRTQADWVNLKRKYKEVWKDENWLAQGIHMLISMKTGNLVQDMKDELNNKELQQCRDILLSKGITPDF